MVIITSHLVYTSFFQKNFKYFSVTFDLINFPDLESSYHHEIFFGQDMLEAKIQTPLLVIRQPFAFVNSFIMIVLLKPFREPLDRFAKIISRRGFCNSPK